MLLEGTLSSAMPGSVILEGDRTVRLADHIVELTEDEQTIYQYDEVVFKLPEDRTDTIADIEQDFEGWWAYGAQPDYPEATLEERVTDLEDIVFDLIGGNEDV